MSDIYLNSAQFAAEVQKCLQCSTKPCEKACPAGVSPCDFIEAAINEDFEKAGKMILNKNPLAEVCGLICPDKFCRKACLRANLDCAINIPKVQAYIMKKYREHVSSDDKKGNGKPQKFAVIGAGPAGIGAASVLLKSGFEVEVFEKSSSLGGALNMIPDVRLPKEIITAEWQYLIRNYPLNINLDSKAISHDLLHQGFAGVIVAIGENVFRKLGIEGESLAVNYDEYLLNPQKFAGLKNVAIVGGGAAAVDCTINAKLSGAEKIEMFVRRRICDMRVTEAERKHLMKNKVDITTMTRITKILKEDEKLTAYTCKTQFDEEGKLIDVPNTEIARKGFDLIVLALGSTVRNLPDENKNIVLAGDCLNGSSTAVEAVASGKSAAERLLKNLFLD